MPVDAELLNLYLPTAVGFVALNFSAFRVAGRQPWYRVVLASLVPYVLWVWMPYVALRSLGLHGALALVVSLVVAYLYIACTAGVTGLGFRHREFAVVAVVLVFEPSVLAMVLSVGRRLRTGTAGPEA